MESSLVDSTKENIEEAGQPSWFKMWLDKFSGHNHDGLNSRLMEVDELTADQLAAIAGTSGTPSATNKFVTNDDTATAATADKVARRLASGDITVPATPTNATDAASKEYAYKVMFYASPDNQMRIENTSVITSGAKYFQIMVPGKVRIRITFKSNSGGDASVDFFRVINDDYADNSDDIEYNIDRFSTTSTTYQTQSRDFFVSAGDIIKITPLSDCSVSTCQICFEYSTNIITSAWGLDLTGSYS